MKTLVTEQIKMLNDVARERSLYVEGAMSHGKISRVTNVKGVTMLAVIGYRGKTMVRYNGERFTDGYGQYVML